MPKNGNGAGIRDLVAWSMANPAAAEQELDRLDAEESLIAYMRQVWPVLEPSRPMVEGWALGAICEHLQAVTDGQIKRLLINVPPGMTKSMTTDVFWPSWEWGPKNLPYMRYVCISYSDALTIRDNRRCRAVILSPTYQAKWGSRFGLLAGEQNAKIRFDNDHTGWKIATSIGGSVSGERGDRVIIDDPHKVNEAESDTIREEVLRTFTEVVTSRVNDDQSVIVVIMQRIHERDTSGLILAHELGYDHLCLPMEHEVDHPHPSRTALNFVDPRTEDGELLAPGRFSQEFLDGTLKPSLRAWGGTYAEAGQLQQRPAPRGGGTFKKSDFQIRDQGPEKVVARCRGWDFAGSETKGSKYTAGVKMAIDAAGRIWIEDMERLQATPGKVEMTLKRTTERDGKSVTVDIPQDPGQAGKSQVLTFVRLLHGFVVRSSPESGSKEIRARPLAAQGELGNLFCIRAPWNDALINEAVGFPTGRYTDQIDAASRAYARLVKMTSRRRKQTICGPEVISSA